MRLEPSQRTGIVCALGTAQTIAWASSYYLPAVLATPMARDLSVSPVWIFAAFSAAMIVSALVGPWSGARIDRLGGRGVLIASNLVFVAGLTVLGSASHLLLLFAGWLLMGLGMGIGLYDSAFASLAAIYGRDARTPITGITLIAGFASTIGWPLSAVMEAEAGWRFACFGWAALHLLVALPLNLLLPSGTMSLPKVATEDAREADENPRLLHLGLLGFVFAVTWFTSTAMAAHLPRLLEAAGTTTVAAVAAGALIGPAQVAARVLEFAFLRRMHPLVSARLATLTHPLGALVLMAVGGPAAALFTLLHGSGNGILTIAKGTLPLALFGPASYGLRQGIISAPARVLQAFSPLLFGFALERYGANAIWLTFGLGVAAFVALLALRPRP